MKGLPDSKIYEEELKYMPYRKSLASVMEIVCSETPEGGSVLDLMCGPGYLLGMLAQERKDLRLHGVDIDQRYIEHAKETYPSLTFEQGDVLAWEPQRRFNTVMCTGALHHLKYEDQPKMIEKIPAMVKSGGLFVLSDCYIDDYSDEIERKVAAAKLGYEYLIATIKNGAPKEVVEATAEILYNDVVGDEFKTSLTKRTSMMDKVLRKTFRNGKLIKTWPDNYSEFGDFILTARRVARV